MTTDPATCTHPDFRVEADVHRILDIGAFVLDLRVTCAACDLPFEFVGVPGGLSYEQPRAAYGGKELHIPIRPPGTRLPGGIATGFSIQQAPPQAQALPDQERLHFVVWVRPGPEYPMPEHLSAEWPFVEAASAPTRGMAALLASALRAQEPELDPRITERDFALLPLGGTET